MFKKGQRGLNRLCLEIVGISVLVGLLVVLPYKPALGEADLGVFLGVNYPSKKDVRDFEDMIGRHVGSVLVYRAISPINSDRVGVGSWNNIRYHDDYDTHTGLHLVLEPWVGLTDITRGIYDDEIGAYADAVAGWEDPVRIRFGHEMIQDDDPSTEGWYGWQDRPEEYKAAFAYVHDLFVQHGANNAEFVWAPNHHLADFSILSKYYPGKEYVDWIGMDGWGYPDTDFDAVFKQLYDVIVNHPEFFGDKPIMLAEFAAMEGDYKAAWIQDAFNKIKNEYNKISAVYWFNVKKEHDWRVESSQESLEASKEAVKDAYFRGHRIGSSGSWAGSSNGGNEGEGPVFSKTIDISVDIPEQNEIKVVISRVNVSTNDWERRSDIDFGNLRFDKTRHIFVSNCYYVVDIGIVSNHGEWMVSHEITPILGPQGASLDRNVSVVFASMEGGREKVLGRYLYKDSRRSFHSSEIRDRWLRIYYGISMGIDVAGVGVEPITTDKPAGQYSGTISIVLVAR